MLKFTCGKIVTIRDSTQLAVWHRWATGSYPSVLGILHESYLYILWNADRFYGILIRIRIILICYSLLVLPVQVIIHWGRVTHICVSKLTTIGLDKGLSPGRPQVIILTNAGMLLWTNFSEIWIEIHTFLFKKIHIKCRLLNGSHFVSIAMCYQTRAQSVLAKCDTRRWANYHRWLI